jgi:hypothetical protein
MNMYHTDPMKVVAMALKEQDRRMGTITIGSFQTTPADEPEKAIKNAKNGLEYIINDSKETDDNPIFKDTKDNKLSEQEFRVSATKLIESLNGRVVYYSGMNKELTLRISDMDEQLAPVRNLLNDHPNADVTQLALTRKEMLDKNLLPLEKEMEEKDAAIKTLQEQLEDARRKNSEVCEELSIVQGTHDDEMNDMDDYVQQLEEGYAPKKKKAPSKAKKDKATTSKSQSEAKGITAIASSKTCSHLSIYTKRDYEGDHFAFVPGRSNNFKSLSFTYRGLIKLNKKKTLNQYLKSFEDNSTAYKSHQGLTFMIEQSPESFERTFSTMFKENIMSKCTSTEYKIGSNDTVCSY